MDRIRKALDLARRERERIEPTLGSHGGGADTVAYPPFEPRAGAAPGLPVRIEYTHTRIFHPDPAALESKRILDPEGEGSGAAAFRMLRTQVMQRADENGWRSIAILSPGMHDGKTTTAINLAVSLANDRRHTVLLVDCDLKRPAIAANLGIDVDLGIDDLLRGTARVDECLYHPQGFDRLVVLPARAALGNSSEMLTGPRGREIVAELRGRYPDRIIVFDLPPVLNADDALAFLPLVECGLVVVAERSTRRDELVRCMELLRNTPILGTVLTKATDVASAYG
jgi:protein-tyrosine kinase